MKIAVYLGSTPGNDPSYVNDAACFGAMLAESGNKLVYGGAGDGTMGALAEGVRSHGGNIIGVIPDFFLHRAFDGLSERYVVTTMSERKAKMMELADAFIAFPGGPGTMEEITEVISAVRIGLRNVPCVIYSPHGYYEDLERQYDHMVEKGFLSQEERGRFVFVRTLEEAADALGIK